MNAAVSQLDFVTWQGKHGGWYCDIFLNGEFVYGTATWTSEQDALDWAKQKVALGDAGALEFREPT